MVKSIHQGKTWPITGCSRTWGWAQVSSGRISDRWGRLECWGRLDRWGRLECRCRLECAGEGRWVGGSAAPSAGKRRRITLTAVQSTSITRSSGRIRAAQCPQHLTPGPHLDLSAVKAPPAAAFAVRFGDGPGAFPLAAPRAAGRGDARMFAVAVGQRPCRDVGHPRLLPVTTARDLYTANGTNLPICRCSGWATLPGVVQPFEMAMCFSSSPRSGDHE
jgi:hypothetical protein